MVVVAVAGGASGLGSNIVNAILSAGSQKLIVLSRAQQQTLLDRGVEVRIVDYSRADQLKDALHGVHTVISCISGYGSVSMDSQLALIEAAKQARVSRFVPSDWATDCYDEVNAYADKERVWQAVRSSGLEYTRFIVGFWTNTWGSGALRDESEALSGYKGPPFGLDLKSGSLTVPGDGSQKVVFTTMQDVGRFVAASLDLPNWKPDSRVVGDNLTFNELEQLVERVTGRKLQVTRVPVEESKRILEREPDFFTTFYHQLLLAISRGRMDFSPTLNELFPDVIPITVEEYLEKHWKSD